MNMKELASLIGATLVEVQDIQTDTFPRVPKNNKLRIRQAIGIEILSRVDEFTKQKVQLGTINLPKPPCGLMRTLLKEASLFVFSDQGVTGRAIRACFDENCQSIKQQLAIKLVAFDKLPNDNKKMSLPQNYEVYVLNLLNKLVYEKKTPHVVLLYLSYICHCADYIPTLTNANTLLMQSEKHTQPSRKARAILSQFIQKVPYDRRKINNGISMSANTRQVYGTLLSLFNNRDELIMQICSIWAAWVTNYFRTVVFPPVDKPESGTVWKFAKFQTLLLLAMIYYPSVLGPQMELLGYYAFIEPTTSLEHIIANVHLPSKWQQYIRTINIAVNTITGQTTLPNLALKITDLQKISYLLPVVNLTVSPRVKVGSRVYNFNVRTILTEWVKGASLRDLIQRNWYILSGEDYAVIYFQYLYTMHVIQTNYPGFSHNDGHLSNILLSFDTEAINKWPLKIKNIVRGNTKYVAEVLDIDSTYAVTLKSRRGIPITFTSWKAPLKIKKNPGYNEYRLLNQTCFVPTTSGISVRLWDFDWTNIKSAAVQNEKTILKGDKSFIYADAGEYYDIYLFFQQILSMRFMDSTNALNPGEPNMCREDYTLLFPPEIQAFHSRVLNGHVDCESPTYASQRLKDTHMVGKYPSIAHIINEEIKHGIFARFAQVPIKVKRQNIYTNFKKD
jgi:hypothetical protein